MEDRIQNKLNLMQIPCNRRLHSKYRDYFYITCHIDNNPCDDENHILFNCKNKISLKKFLEDFLNQNIIDKI